MPEDVAVVEVEVKAWAAVAVVAVVDAGEAAVTNPVPGRPVLVFAHPVDTASRTRLASLATASSALNAVRR